jgi:NitT/TauT family transport system substrate-binding protein
VTQVFHCEGLSRNKSIHDGVADNVFRAFLERVLVCANCCCITSGPIYTNAWIALVMFNNNRHDTMCFIGRWAPRIATMLAAVTLSLQGAPARAQTTLRVGHFPNVTHVQALIAHNMTRQGKGWFEQRLGPGTKVEWFVYNAGPSAMEAVFAKSIDLTYVGPNPAINAYFKSNGQEGRIVAGSVNGGSALVVRDDSTLKTPADFKGKKIATPQFGNTQDVAARAWLVSGGLAIKQTGGDAQVVPTANPDQLLLFKQKQLDAVWTVEPWISRLEQEAGGKVLIDDRDAITTVLVARSDMLTAHKDVAQKFVAAQRELTEWIKANPDAAQDMVRNELDAELHTKFSSPRRGSASCWQTISRSMHSSDLSRAHNPSASYAIRRTCRTS